MSRPLRLNVHGLAFAAGLVGLGALGACLLPDEHADLNPITSSDGGPGSGDAAEEPSPPGFATQTGRIIDLDSRQGVTGALVDLGGKTATTGDKGAYSIQVPLNSPFSMVVTGAPEHIKLIEQEWLLTGDFDRDTTSFVATSTSNTLRSALPGYDPTLANIGVGLTKVDPSLGGNCATEGGATITLELPGQTDAGADAGAPTYKLLYFQGGFPSKVINESQDGEITPTAIFYNVPPGEGYKIHVVHPTCQVVDYPYTEGPITYTGGLRAEAGDAASFVRVFLK